MKKIVLSLLLILASGAVIAQNTKDTKWIDIGRGLSNNFIMSLDLDRNGALWIGTEEGMDRFDGVSVMRLGKRQGVLPGDAVNQVLPDRNGSVIWIATQRDGLVRYDSVSGESVFLTSEDGILPSDEITHIEQDDEGRIWFSTYTKGLGRYNPTDGSVSLFNSSNVQGMDDLIIRCFRIGVDGNIYTASYGQGIFILNPETRKVESFRHQNGKAGSLPSNEIASIYKDASGNIWVGTRRGLALYLPVTRSFQVFDKDNSGLPDGLIFSEIVTSDGRLVVSPDFNGAWYVHLDSLSVNPHFAPLPEAESMCNIGVHAMVEDRFGNLWLGSYGKGILFVSHRPTTFRILTQEEGLGERSVTSLDFRSDNSLALGTDGGGVDILDAGLTVKARLQDALTDKSTLAVKEDSRGRIWIATFNGDVSVTDRNLRIITNISTREARDFYEDGERMFILGLSRITTVDMNTLRPLEYYRHSFPRTIYADLSDNIWVGFFRSGLQIFSPTMELLRSYDTSHGFPSNFINDILRDRSGNMWVATGEGLVRFPAGQTGYDKVYGGDCASHFIRAVVEDKNGSIWFSTNLSICRIDSDGKVEEFTYHNGIADGNYNSAAASVRNDGLLGFGSTEGATFFYPESLEAAGDTPALHYSVMHIYDNHNPLENKESTMLVNGRKEVNLKYFQNNFDISFAADDHSVEKDLEYSYRIKGRDDKWYPADGNRVEVRDLKPGKYTLSVKARYPSGDWDSDSFPIKITITPPLYASTVAKILYAIFAIAMAAGVALFSVARIRRRNAMRLEKESLAREKNANEERLRFYSNMTHELKTPITLILGPTEDLKNDASLPEAARRKIGIVNKNANSLLELTNRLLEFRKAETRSFNFSPIYGNLGRQAADILSVFAESNTNGKLAFVSRIQPDINCLYDHDIVSVIINNLLSNAAKYTREGEVTLTVDVEDDKEVVIEVSDTGTGIPKDDIEKIFSRYYKVPGTQVDGTGIGLSLVKSLAELHGGTVTAESVEGRGSTFRVVLPLVLETGAQKSSGKPEEPDSQPIIIVTEDNEDIRDYIEGTLSPEYKVYTAANGSEAYDLAVKLVPDIVVSDIMMPVMDGIELCRKIKGNVSLSHIPVVLLTAKDSNEDRKEGYEAGADSYISKPFTSEMLKARIKNLLDARRKIAGDISATRDSKDLLQIMKANYSPMDNNFIKKINSLIEENLSSGELGVEWLATQMNMSVSTLYRKFKGLMGISANEYIRKIRMHKAAEMMATGNYNVSETAWRVGIGSLIYFRQSFKEEFGMTPSEYIKKTTKTIIEE